VVIACTLASTVASFGSARTPVAPSKYLLAVGDSLAAGYQPADRSALPPVDTATGFRDQGYPGSYAAGIAAAKGLALVDLACPGETTSSMLTTPAQALCGSLYEGEFGVASQIAAATTFLSRTRGRVGLVTVDVGANDLDHCYSASSVNSGCLESSDVAAVKNLARILTLLVAALHRDDPGARIAGMDYYDPFLGLEFSPGGLKSDEIALGSLAATNAFDTELTATFRKLGAIPVGVAAAFRINAVTPVVHFDNKTLPQDVASVCQLTWMCSTKSGQSADIHPNAAGYRLIAATFEKQLGS
jgi:lysophospholipase L1-like esterase